MYFFIAMKKLLLISILLIVGSTATIASHLMGGSLTYQFRNHNNINNVDTFRVKLQLFRDCSSGVMLANPIILGVYSQDVANPNSDKVLFSTFSLIRDSLQMVIPPTPGDSCNFVDSVCVQEGDYHVDIALPVSAGGYHLMVQLNARNAAITNLANPGNLGQTYYTFIPPSSFQNHSPVFADIPVPFICTNDTVSIVNLATDADGDSLSYSFVVPYDSYTHANPTPPAPGIIHVPPQTVPYAGGYSFTQPFGANGYSAIDSVSGLTRYFIPGSGGFYVVCVQINEYRNGILIAATRRDLQLIAIVCPVNPAPVLTSSGGSQSPNYFMTEGETLCIPVIMADPNGDSVFVHASGQLFDSTIVNPYATLPDASGHQSATSQFCWSTICGQGKSAPYQFTVSARDNGCPPKISNVVYSIYVHPFTGPVTINGPDTLCNMATGAAYTVSNVAGNIYHWSVTNGSQVSGGNTSAITVDWNNALNGIISVYTESPHGCISDTIAKSVFLKPLPVAVAGGDVSFCSGQSAGIGNSPQTGYAYSWNPATGLNNVIAAQPTVTLTNSTANPVTLPYILSATLNGCTDSDTTQVTVRPLPVSNAGNDRSVCSGDTVHLGTFSTFGYSYAWSPSTGLSNTSVSNPDILVSNTSASAFSLVFHVTTTLDNCVTEDSIQLTVNPLPNISATATPDTICEGESASLNGFGAITYTWENILNPGVIIGSGNIFNVSPVQTTTYIITGTAVTNCINRDTITLIESPLPNVQTTASPDSICAGNSSNLAANGALNYWWALLSLPNDTVATGSTYTITPDSSVTYIITGINAFGCINKDTLVLTLNPAPLVDSIYGTQSICPGVSGVGYIALPFTSSSTYQWIVHSGTIDIGQGLDTVFVTWDSISGPGSISVIEITNHLCVSDTVTLPVDINVLLSPATPFGITPICEENSDSSVYYTFNTPGSTYNWQVINGTILNGNGTNTVTIHWDSTGAAAGIIWYFEHSVTVDTFCNGISDTLFVTIHKSPVTSLIDGTNAICEFTTGNIFSVLPDSAAIYHWTLTEGTIVQGNGTNSIHINWGQAGTALLSVTETNYFGCVGRRVDTTVFVYAQPQSMFSALFKPTCTGIEAKLIDASQNELNYVWLFGDGTTVADSNVLPQDTITHLYPFGNNPTISLIAINHVCNDTMHFQLPDIGIDNALDSLPNVFTPNGDGVNDCFQITPTGGLNDCATITIFNRWGTTVFEGDTEHRCWNGKTPGGNDCDDGIYYFTVKVGNAAKNGFVQLIRK